MATAVKENEIFRLATLIRNVRTKLSEANEPGQLADHQIICLVLENNELLLRYTSSLGEVILKKLVWFRETGKVVQAVCFDPAGTWLLVFCYDNTLHVVPALFICDKSAKFQLVFSATQISSFVVPFIGPHECVNPKTCPNTASATPTTTNTTISSPGNELDRAAIKTTLPGKTDGVYSAFFGSEAEVAGGAGTGEENTSVSISSTPNDSQMLSSSSTGAICPYPTAVTWWKTLSGQYRAILGYSDGTICVVGLTINCPFVGSTSVERGSVERMVVCRDNAAETITLMINTSTKEQWKLLLEQKSIGYTFPGEFSTTPASTETKEGETREENGDWQIVVALSEDQEGGKDISPERINHKDCEGAEQESTPPPPQPPEEDASALPKLIPAAKARLLSLRDLGAKKIGTLKLKLAESRLKAKEKEKLREQSASLAIMEAPNIVPEILTTPSGPFFIVQHAQNRCLLSALHGYSDTLSVHSMDISLIPLYLYKLPRNARHVLLTPTLLYTIQSLVDDTPPTADAKTPIEESGGSSSIENAPSSQDDEEETSSFRIFSAFGVVSCAIAAAKLGDDCEFNDRALVSLYRFEDERIVGVHRMVAAERDDGDETLHDSLNSLPNSSPTVVSGYFNLPPEVKRKFSPTHFDPSDAEVLQSRFPRVNFEKCVVVTDRNVYAIELAEQPHILFLRLADQANWAACEDFCKIFDLSMAQCVEFAGDVLLRKKKVTQALLTYNVARIPPIKTALKLAIFNEVNALMHLCAMAIKNTFILNSRHAMHPSIKHLLDTAHLRHLQYAQLLRSQSAAAARSAATPPAAAGQRCSDFSYEKDEVASDLNMSHSSQFHLSNLLLLALTERCVRDKAPMPLWNYIATNAKFHTSLASVVLAQSGLYSAAVLLAMTRGACMDVFSCLVGAAEHVLDAGGEWNVYMFNASEPMFVEAIVYLQDYAMDFFDAVRRNLAKFELKILDRLAEQLSPFGAVYRPVMALARGACQQRSLMEFVQRLLETYLLVLMQRQALKLSGDKFLNALSEFTLLEADEAPHTVRLENAGPLSAGFSHAAYVEAGAVYLWGSNGLNCALSRNLIVTDSGESSPFTPTCLEFFRELDIAVVAVHCGKAHTIFTTNNGLYAMGANQLGQLGIGKLLAQALQPMLIRALDGRRITQVCAGQYHNAAVVDGNLYTWGWGIFGQLGNGGIDNIYEPEEVKFFNDKKILQIALGHAHTLVLCEKSPLENTLYVFGSNHYGQLGVGQQRDATPGGSPMQGDSNSNNSRKKTFVKSTVPLILQLGGENIRLIHTKFFCNLVVTDSNRLYIWGTSPQALRLSTQARKRAKASQKEEEQKEPPPPPMDMTPDDPELDDVFLEKANTEEREKAVVVPEIKVDEVETPPVESKASVLLEEATDHLYPALVDQLDDEVVQLASGLYHFALATVTGQLYTWGKNLERQLGREGGRNDVLAPTALEGVMVRFVECGADFTLIVTKDGGVVRGFGNNNQGQCARESQPDKSGIAGKLVRLRISKRLVRIPDSSQCIETPADITVPVFTSAPDLKRLRPLPTFDSRLLHPSPLASHAAFRPSSSDGIDANLNLDLINGPATPSPDDGRPFDRYLSASAVPDVRGAHFLHFCLAAFHGLYEHSALVDLAEHLSFREYRIRLHLLARRPLDAFKLCLAACGDTNPAGAIRLFEHFSHAASVDAAELKFYVHEIFRHFIAAQMALEPLEEHLLADLDLLLLPLSYVLYFNNNNSPLEKSVFKKYRPLFGAHENFAPLENVDVIFKMISTKFNVIVCQKLIEYADAAL